MDAVALAFFIVVAIIGWKIVSYGIRIHDEANAEAQNLASEKNYKNAINEMEKARIEVIRELSGLWNEFRADYTNALQDGDIFLATAKGRIFYALNRRLSMNKLHDQVIVDEIQIKNEVANRRAEPINLYNLEDLDAEELHALLNNS